MRRILRICGIAWTRFGNYPDSPLPDLLLFDSGHGCRLTPRFFFFWQGQECRSLALQRERGATFPGEAGVTAFENRMRGSTSKCGSKGLGRCPNKQKLGFPATPEISVSSLCENKDTACQVVKNLYLVEHFRKNQLGKYIVYLLCNLF